MATYKGYQMDEDGNILLPIGSDVAPLELTSKASKAYTKGEYLFYNNNFYKVNSAIASGGTLTPGSNISATTLGTELKNAGFGCPNYSQATTYTPGISQTITEDGYISIFCWKAINTQIINIWINSKCAYYLSGNCTPGYPNILLPVHKDDVVSIGKNNNTSTAPTTAQTFSSSYYVCQFIPTR